MKNVLSSKNITVQYTQVGKGGEVQQILTSMVFYVIQNCKRRKKNPDSLYSEFVGPF